MLNRDILQDIIEDVLNTVFHFEVDMPADPGLIDSFTITCESDVSSDGKSTRVGASLGTDSYGTFNGNSFVIGDGTTISTDGTVSVFTLGSEVVDLSTTALSPSNQFKLAFTTDQESLPSVPTAANYFNRIVLQNSTQSTSTTLNFSDIDFISDVQNDGGNESIQFIYRPAPDGTDVGWVDGDVINIQLRSD
jgi:hypothetical protein